MLTGFDTFDAGDVGHAARRLPPSGAQALRLPRRLAQRLAEPLRAIVDRATEAQPRLRYRNARTLLHALDGWLQTAAGGDAGPLARLTDRVRSVGRCRRCRAAQRVRHDSPSWSVDTRCAGRHRSGRSGAGLRTAAPGELGAGAWGADCGSGRADGAPRDRDDRARRRAPSRARPAAVAGALDEAPGRPAALIPAVGAPRPSRRGFDPRVTTPKSSTCWCCCRTWGAWCCSTTSSTKRARFSA